MTLTIAVLDDYQGVAETYGDWSLLGGDVEIKVFREPVPVSEAGAVLGGFDVLCMMRERMPLPAGMIAALPRLKLVVVTGGRVRTMDLDAAAERGIAVCHTRNGEGGIATPELAWALMLALARNLPEEDRRVREGFWQRTVGETLSGKMLGLVGLGRLGSRMVPVAKAFGMETMAWSPNLTDERAAEAGSRRVDKQELFASADIVSVHMILGPTTRGLIGTDEIAAMKPGAMLINTARGPLVDEAALLKALTEKRIRAGLDVFDVEPLPADHPLRTAPNTVLTPHLGYVTTGSYRQFFEDTIEDILAWRQGAPLRLLNTPKG